MQKTESGLKVNLPELYIFIDYSLASPIIGIVILAYPQVNA